MTPEDQDLDHLRNNLTEARDLIRKGKVDVAGVLLDELVSKTYSLLLPREILQQALSLRAQIEKRKKLRANRTWLLLVLIITGLILSVLVNTKMRNIEIYAELQARRIEIELADSLRIGEINLEEIELNGMDTIETFAAYSWKPLNNELNTNSTHHERPDNIDEEHILLKSAAQNFSVGMSGEGMYLEKANIGRKMVLTASSEHKNARRLVIAAPSGDLSGEIQVGDQVKLKCFGSFFTNIPANNFYLNLTPEEPITFSGKHGSNIVLKDKFNGNRIVLANHFAINELNFVDSDNEINQSTLTAGEIRFPNISFEPIIFRPGDSLFIHPTKSFKVIQLEYGPNITLRIKGKAHDIKKNMVSILPSCLEWIHQSNEIILYIGALSSLVSFVWLFIKRLELIRD